MATLRNTSVPADLIQRSIRKFHIVVLPRKSKKQIKQRDARSELLFCLHNQLFLTSSSPNSAKESKGLVESRTNQLTTSACFCRNTGTSLSFSTTSGLAWTSFEKHLSLDWILLWATWTSAMSIISSSSKPSSLAEERIASQTSWNNKEPVSMTMALYQTYLLRPRPEQIPLNKK